MTPSLVIRRLLITFLLAILSVALLIFFFLATSSGLRLQSYGHCCFLVGRVGEVASLGTSGKLTALSE